MADLHNRLKTAVADRYAVERELGAGGMATVYLAQDLKHERQVAIKVLRPELASALGPERFLREIKTTARLNHPHILPLLDSGEADGLLYYVMPFVAGESLRERLEREKQLPIDEAVQIARDIAGALAYAHSFGVIHRDIKPENILLAGGHARVADFGIARAVTAAGGERLTETGLAIGTPAYMSPEQGTGSTDLDGRSDIYSLGCVLYEMLAGEPPYTGPTAQAVIAKRLSEPLPRISVIRETVPAPIEQALAKGLARVPADRFSTAQEFSTALVVHPMAYRRRPRPPPRSRRGLVAAAAVVLLALGSVAFAQYWAATSWKRVELDPNAVAIMPFRVTATDPAIASLDEGVIDLLYPILSGGDLPRAIEPNPFLLAWNQRRAGGELNGADAPLRLAAQFRAAHLLEGSVTQAGSQITLNGWLRTVPHGALVSRYNVSGSPDSVHVLVHRLAVGLLGTHIGESAERVATFVGRSPQAVASYLSGARAYREGRWDEAAQSFERAFSVDSVFGLAALRWYQASVLGYAARSQRSALAAANALRASLGPRERVALDVELVSQGIDTVRTWAGELGAIRNWLGTAPDEPQAWIRYATVLRHAGPLLEVEDWERQARDAFKRAWHLDSTTPALVSQHVVWGVATDDFEWVRRVGARYLEVGDTTSDDWLGARWAIAVLGGDSATVRLLRTQLRAGRLKRLGWVPWNLGRTSFTLASQIDDADSVAAFIRRGVPTAADSQYLAWYYSMTGMIRGRVRQVAELQTGPIGRSWFGRVGQWRLLLLWWLGHPGFDSAAAIAVDSLRAVVPGNEETVGSVCYVELYRAARGDTIGAREAARESLPHHRESLCPAMVEALVESHDLKRGNTPALDRLETLLREVPHEFSQAGLPVLVRLRRQRGQLDQALAAARLHNWWGWLYPHFQTTLLKEQGDLATATGDTTGAIAAYEKYLRLKTDPDPGPVAQEVQAVRQALQELLRARG